MSTTKEILSPYLAYEIKVEVEYERFPPKEIGRLASLSLNGPSAQVHFDDPQVRGGFVPVVCALHELTPVLRPFTSLGKQLADKTVPAVELAKLAVEPEFGEIFFRSGSKVEVYGPEKGQLPRIEISGMNTARPLLVVYSDWTMILPHTARIGAMVDYLRSLHFAVGLEPHQFIEKVD